MIEPSPRRRAAWRILLAAMVGAYAILLLLSFWNMLDSDEGIYLYQARLTARGATPACGFLGEPGAEFLQCVRRAAASSGAHHRGCCRPGLEEGSGMTTLFCATIPETVARRYNFATKNDISRMIAARRHAAVTHDIYINATVKSSFHEYPRLLSTYTKVIAVDDYLFDVPGAMLAPAPVDPGAPAATAFADDRRIPRSRLLGRSL